MNGAIWKTDGINPPVIFRGYNGFSSSSSSGKMAVSNGKLFFNNPEDYELWATDGTEAGTYFHGRPKVEMQATGTLHLNTINQAAIQRKIINYRYYPLLKIETGIKF